MQVRRHYEDEDVKNSENENDSDLTKVQELFRYKQGVINSTLACTTISVPFILGIFICSFN